MSSSGQFWRFIISLAYLYIKTYLISINIKPEARADLLPRTISPMGSCTASCTHSSCCGCLDCSRSCCAQGRGWMGIQAVPGGSPELGMLLGRSAQLRKGGLTPLEVSVCLFPSCHHSCYECSVGEFSTALFFCFLLSNKAPTTVGEVSACLPCFCNILHRYPGKFCLCWCIRHSKELLLFWSTKQQLPLL